MDVPIMVLGNLRRGQVVLWPLPLTWFLGPRDPSFVELLRTRTTYWKILRLRRVLRSIIRVIKQLAVWSIRNNGSTRILNCVLSRGVRVGGGSKVLVLNLTVYIYYIFVLIKLLDLGIYRVLLSILL
jgi:hypothetical protein